MKKIKNILFAALMLASTVLIQSCNDDDDFVYYTEMGTVSYAPTTNSQYRNIDGDESGLCYLLNEDALKYSKTDSVGQRIIYSYTLEDVNRSGEQQSQEVRRYIKIFDIYKVLTKRMDTLDPDNQADLFGNDDILINGMYISAMHLNIRFIIGRSAANIAHRISLVGMKDAKPDADGVLTLELRHNDFNDTPAHAQVGFVSYTLESIPGFKEGTLKKLIIKYKSSNDTTSTEEISLNDNSIASFYGRSLAPQTNAIY